MKNSTTPKRSKKLLAVLNALGVGLLCILLLISTLAFFSAKWYVDTYGQMGFDSILYTLLADLTGVETELIFSYLQSSLIPAIICTSLTMLFLFPPLKKRLVLILFKRLRIRLFPLRRWLSYILCILLSWSLIFQAAEDTEFLAYLEHLSKMSTLYQDEYWDPATVNITFPEKKRNLIYIFLESMECSFFDESQGGFLADNVIPELYDLASQNINFSHNDSVGGFRSATGSAWTIGAMVSQTAGIPLKTPPGLGGNEYGTDGTFLPGVTSINNILHDNGYYQALMVGSDATFGGRQQYFSSHGVDRIYDIQTFWEDNIVEDGRHVWWGAEDMYLFEYAKQALTEISKADQPFAFTMLTVDTHHIGGYICEACRSDYEERYENVYACSSRQVSAFVKWIQEQEFYENTTIVVVGDHPSMDGSYMKRKVPENYTRMVYNCILNSAVETDNSKNRTFCALDMFPTTLAALGCVIEGNRLALGTNLFSDLPTLAELKGFDAFNSELARSSAYYTSNFFFSH